MKVDVICTLLMLVSIFGCGIQSHVIAVGGVAGMFATLYLNLYGVFGKE